MSIEWNLKEVDERKFLFLCLCLSILVGLVARMPILVSSDFPVGDGALFLRMIEAIRANGYVLPTTVHYNQEAIPFAYPPFGLYLGALISDGFGVEVIDVLRVVPLLINLLTIAAFVLLVSRLAEYKVVVLAASLVFPALPWSYEWVIVGGGITRSVGFLTTVLALYAIARFQEGRSWKRFVACLLPLSAAIATHLEWGISATVAVSLYVFTSSRSFSKSLKTLLPLGIGAAILTSPWWVTVLYRFGLSPFMAASDTSYWNLGMFLKLVGQFKIFTLFVGDVFSWFVLCGWLVCLARKKWFLPLWLPAIFLTTPRHSGTIATVPLAFLIAIGMQSVESWIRSVVVSAQQEEETVQQTLVRKMRVFSFVPYVVGTCVFASVILHNLSHPPTPLLTKHQRLVMEAIRQKTEPAARFLVIANYTWSKNVVAEWFPVLTDRKSLSTVQGQEWIPEPGFQQARGRHEVMLQLVGIERRGMVSDALVRFAEAAYGNFDYVAVFMQDVETRFGGFLATRRYKVHYFDPETLVLRKTPSPKESS